MRGRLIDSLVGGGLALAALLSLAVCAASCMASHGWAVQRTVRLSNSGQAVVGRPAPWFAGWTLDEPPRVVNLEKLRRESPARAYLLVFFATQCREGCIPGLRQLAASRDRLQKLGVKLVLVNYRDEAPTARPFLQELGLAGELALEDRQGANARAFGVEQDHENGQIGHLPRTVLLDAQGLVLAILAEEGPDYLQVILETVSRLPSAQR